MSLMMEEATSTIDPQVERQVRDCFFIPPGGDGSEIQKPVRDLVTYCVKRARPEGFSIGFGLTNEPTPARLAAMQRVTSAKGTTDAARRIKETVASSLQCLSEDELSVERRKSVSMAFDLPCLSEKATEQLPARLRSDVARMQFTPVRDGEAVTCKIDRAMTYVAVLLGFFPLSFPEAESIAEELKQRRGRRPFLFEGPEALYNRLLYWSEHKGWPLADQFRWLDDPTLLAMLHRAEQGRQVFDQLADARG